MSSDKLYGEMTEVLKHEVVDRHSYFQLKYFVVSKEPTLQSQMWRCLRELKTRKESIDGLKVEIEDSLDKKKLLEIQIKKEYNINCDHDEILKTEKEIKIRRLTRKMSVLENTIKKLDKNLKYAEEEALFFLEYFKKLSDIEPLREYDDMKAQSEYWNIKFLNELNMQLLFGQPINMELIKSILSLQDDSQAKQAVIKLINNQKAIEKKE